MTTNQQTGPNRASRRGVLGSVTKAGLGIAMLGLAACASGGTSTATAQQVVADITGELTAAQMIITAGAQWIGAATVAKVNGWLTEAENGMAALGVALTNTATGTTVQTVEGYIADILAAFATAITGVSVPAWLSTAVAAMQALLPAITAFVNLALGSVGTLATVNFKPIRDKLRIPTFKAA